MKNSMFQTPISLHVFNRPETTRTLFNEIKKIRPEKLFITADGPRVGHPDDQKNCREVRGIINEIDWDCELHTNFSEANKGSFKSTSEGITWAFKHVERAIILEDDCIPNSSFFTFCEELLNYYENDKRIALISGNNFQGDKNKTEDSYYFSRYTHIWGWATWKRTWDQVDFSMKNWPEYKKNNGLKSLFHQEKEIKYWATMYQEMYDKKRKPHWDFLLSLSSYMNNTVSILPNVNLVSNIGFGPDASNCKTQSKNHCLETEAMIFPLQHPKFISRFVVADDFTERNIFSGTSNPIKEIIRKYIPKGIWSFFKKIKIFYTT